MANNETVDHLIWKESNSAHYAISIVARLKSPVFRNVAYLVRLENPQGEAIDFMLTLDGFKKLGELCNALSDFCKQPILTNEKEVKALEKSLNYDNIINYAKISALMKK
jgi:hypothetical protein